MSVRLPRPVVAGVRRTGRMLTSPWRPLPSALVIGGIRCGSTSLYAYLEAGGYAPPDVHDDRKEEIHYFDRHHHRGDRWYRSWFPLRPGRPTFEASPSYLCVPGVAGRVRSTVPDARLFAILRHPATRAESHFRWRRALGGEPYDSLAAALAAEPDRRTHGGSLLGCYRLHSAYDVGLQAWYDAFPAEQICVLFAEKLFAGDEEELERLRLFAGIEDPGPFPRANVGPGLGVGTSELTTLFPGTIDRVEALVGRPSGWT